MLKCLYFHGIDIYIVLYCYRKPLDVLSGKVLSGVPITDESDTYMCYNSKQVRLFIALLCLFIILSLYCAILVYSVFVILLVVKLFRRDVDERKCDGNYLTITYAIVAVIFQLIFCTSLLYKNLRRKLFDLEENVISREVPRKIVFGSTIVSVIISAWGIYEFVVLDTCGESVEDSIVILGEILISVQFLITLILAGMCKQNYFKSQNHEESDDKEYIEVDFHNEDSMQMPV